jgi:hypothetical protein
VLLRDLGARVITEPQLQRALEAGPDPGDLDRVVDDVVGARVPDADEGDGHCATLRAPADRVNHPQE